MTETATVIMPPEILEIIKRNEEERTDLLRQNHGLLQGFIASFEERFPKEQDQQAALAEKRDWFAGQALVAVLNNPEMLNAVEKTAPNARMVARICYLTADAMLKERAK